VVLDEIGLDLGNRQPQTLDDLEDDYFDLIVTWRPKVTTRHWNLPAAMPLR
jgi:protein-tyrosine-phosphatase